jgi:hypothetical protein
VAWFRKSSDELPTSGAEDATTIAFPEIEPLTDDEVVWVRSTIDELAEQGVRTGDIEDLGRHYDELLTEWLRMKESDRPDPHAIINQIGLAFGQHIADHTGLAWGVATSERGPEIALHRPRTPGEVVLYPTDMVAQRWGAHETGMLAPLARATIQAVKDIPAHG